MHDSTVSTIVVWVWGLWAVALALCVAGGLIVLIDGEHIWARAVGLTLLGVELIVVAVASLMTARLLLMRSTEQIEDRIELQDDVRRLRSRR